MRQTQVTLVCDMDTNGTAAVQTVTIGYNKQRYDLDLCQKHLESVEQTMNRLIAPKSHARQAPTSTPRPAHKATTGPKRRSAPTQAELREWARTNGFAVADRGRIPATVEQEFAAQAG